jgi:hypothetical protein
MDTRRRRVQVDADGVRIEKRSGVRAGVWLILFAGALVCAFLFAHRARTPDARIERAAAPRPPVVAANDAPAPRPAAPAIEPHRRAPAIPPAANSEPPPASAPVAAAEPPEKEDPVFGKAEPAQPSGIALFPPPGTKPIKRGVLVPDDFELPPGYVRHYQATDDGERVPAILMFHPDYHPVDADGHPIPLPADRVVPPDQVPAGMPVQMLELPEDQGAAAAAP